MNKHCTEDKNISDEYAQRMINWFPGHMHKAFKKIIEGLKKVDIILEIRDARSPQVTGNKALQDKIGEKARLIVINKTNLADPKIVLKWQEWFLLQGHPFIFINCFDENSLKKVLQQSRAVIAEKRESNGAARSKMKMMIVGLPNTGKSTIINKLANRNATKVAAKPGQTQNQLWVKINADLDLLDTPGVMPPMIATYEQGIWLSIIHAIPDKIVIPETSACYIVEHMLNIKSEIFKKHYKIDNLGPDLVSTLDQIAKNRGCLLQKNQYDYERVYQLILNDFRKGDLGLVSFGLPPDSKTEL